MSILRQLGRGSAWVVGCGLRSLMICLMICLMADAAGVAPEGWGVWAAGVRSSGYTGSGLVGSGASGAGAASKQTQNK
uniref:Uncharacterized protein n=1 Tax=mine drainage metagenome TaxID=410659 RepID=E6QI17_9ZZZZ